MAGTRTRPPRFTLDIEASANGKVGKATVLARDAEGKTVDTDRANLTDAAERGKLAKRMADKLGVDEKALLRQLEAKWNQTLDDHRRFQEQVAAGSPEAAVLATAELLDLAPPTVRRPLCLVNGRAYAAAWVPVRHSVSQSIVAGAPVKHDPPLVTVEDVLLIVAEDGALYADGNAPGARRLADLGLPVRLPATPPPERGWSGAGVKRYLAGERPRPADVFGRVASVVDHYLDFSRSLAPQSVVCELVACYILATYFLDAFNVVGYLWPSGERGTGKTSFLQVVVELAYLGQLILAGSSYACLRDMADYGATLAFDDAEAVMDTRRTDPDKRTLLLAGNRRGATVAVKDLEGDRWVTRHVNTFCPRLFSAIRLPDEVLGSRSIIVSLVRSGDPRRAKANCLDPGSWPCDKRRLLDDLWALGLAHLPELPWHDREAAAIATLAGRNLDPWRPILAVAHWLQERHGVEGLFDRLEGLAVSYQRDERGQHEDSDRTRVLFRVLLGLCGDKPEGEKVTVRPKDLAQRMIGLAAAEDLAEEGKPFTSARKVGHLLKRQRFRRPEGRSAAGKEWELTAKEVRDAASAYGVDADNAYPAAGVDEEETPVDPFERPGEKLPP
jgi:hypothetical protein